jgi:hypothetical protein
MQYELTRTTLTAAGASLLGLCALAPAAADHQTFRVDIAMIGPTFHDVEANPDPARAGIPPNGSPFIIQGYIYRGGTFDRYGDLSGVLPDGSPEFPARVIGKWICRAAQRRPRSEMTTAASVAPVVFATRSQPVLR